jgi:hypothetical protein
MAACTKSGAETQLYDGAIAVCGMCSEDSEPERKAPLVFIRSILHEDLISATRGNSEALREFDEVMDQFPSGLPHPDGAQRVNNASNKLSSARKKMGTAHNRLNDFLGRGIVPEDLKCSG